MASYFGRPNKVILLSYRNTQHLPDTAASTLLRLLKPRLLSLSEHLGAITHLFPHRDVDMWGRVWMSCFRGVQRSLYFYKESLWVWDFSFCNFRDLIYARTACNTSKIKKNLKLHHMTPLIKSVTWSYCSWHYVLLNYGVLQFDHIHPAPFKELSHRKLMFILLCCISCLHCSVKQPFLWLNLYSKPIPTKRCSHTYTQTDVLSTLNTAECVFIQHTMWHGYSKIMNAVQGLEEGVGCSLYCGWE